MNIIIIRDLVYEEVTRIQAGFRVNSSSLMAGVQIVLLHVVFSNDALFLNCAVRTSDLLRPCCSHFILQIMLCVA